MPAVRYRVPVRLVDNAPHRAPEEGRGVGHYDLEAPCSLNFELGTSRTTDQDGCSGSVSREKSGHLE